MTQPTEHTTEPYIERECDCGHREHIGACRVRHTYYAPVTVPLPEGSQLIATHKRAADAGLRAYTVPCDCLAFSEYDGGEG